MAKNNVLLTSTNIGAVTLGLSGDNTVASIAPDAVGEAQDGLSQKILSLMANPGGTLTVTTYPQDPNYKFLMDLYNTYRATGGVGVSLAGQAATVNQAWTWRDAIFTDLPEFRREQSATTVDFVLALDGLSPVAL